MQRGVHGRLMDNSTSVREAAVELLGRFVLCRPQLAEQYYDMLIERILVCFFIFIIINKYNFVFLVQSVNYSSFLKKDILCPGQVGTSSHTLKDCGFNSQSGHISRLRVPSTVRACTGSNHLTSFTRSRLRISNGLSQQ